MTDKTNDKNATESKSALNDGSESLKFRTSKRINFATDYDDGETMIELQWGDMTLHLEINDKELRLCGPCFDADVHSINGLKLTRKYPPNAQNQRTERS